MNDPQPSSWHLLNFLWIGAIAAFSYLWKRLDGKADKAQVAERHTENLTQFAEIKAMIRAGDAISSKERHEVRDELGKLSNTVAVLADRAKLHR